MRRRNDMAARCSAQKYGSLWWDRRASAGVRTAVAMMVLNLASTGGRATAQSTPDAPPLFASSAALPVTITADFAALGEDRNESPDRPGSLTVQGLDGRDVVIDVEIRTRGNFRLETCSFPPLRIDVDAGQAEGTPFEGQDDLKLVSSCRPGRESWQELVIKEYLAYRSLQAITDDSFRTRLLEVTFVDASGEEPPDTRVAFVIEEDEALADRLGATVFELEEGKNLPMSAFEPVHRMTNAVWHYMIGNPDWSDVAGHNVELFDRGGVALVVPYDFDFSGLVDAPYATAPPEYRLDSVRERYYRGWCENPFTSREVLGRFRDSREAILELWREAPLLSEDTRAAAIRYLEEFFDDIETGDRAERRFLRDCRPTPRAGSQATGGAFGLSI